MVKMSRISEDKMLAVICVDMANTGGMPRAGQDTCWPGHVLARTRDHAPRPAQTACCDQPPLTSSSPL